LVNLLVLELDQLKELVLELVLMLDLVLVVTLVKVLDYMLQMEKVKAL